MMTSAGEIVANCKYEARWTTQIEQDEAAEKVPKKEWVTCGIPSLMTDDRVHRPPVSGMTKEGEREREWKWTLKKEPK